MGYSGRKLKQISPLRRTLKLFHAVAVLILGPELVIIFTGCGSRSNQGISEAHKGTSVVCAEGREGGRKITGLPTSSDQRRFQSARQPRTVVLAGVCLQRGASSCCSGSGARETTFTVVSEGTPGRPREPTAPGEVCLV